MPLLRDSEDYEGIPSPDVLEMTARILRRSWSFQAEGELIRDCGAYVSIRFGIVLEMATALSGETI